MKKLHITFIALGFVAFGQVQAQEKKASKPKLTPEQKFDQIDKNKDGFIVLAELKKVDEEEKVQGHFKKMDANADAKISKAEFVKYKNAKAAEKAKDKAAEEAKKNEPKPTLEEKFDKKDKNKDGVITVDEIKKDKGETVKDQENKLKKMDADKDGKVTEAEFIKAKKAKEAEKAKKKK